MSTKQNWEAESDRNLDSVLEAVRNQKVPPFPKALDQMMPGVRLQPESKATNRQARFGLNRLSLSASLLVAISALVFVAIIIFWPSNQIVFAQVKEVVKEIKSVSYTVLDIHGDEKTYLTKVIRQEPNLTRSESDHGGVSISNLESGMVLKIDHLKKKATLFETNLNDRMKEDRKGYLASLRDIPTNAIKRLGTTQFEGRPAEQFLAKHGDREFVVTVDAETKLPVEMKFTRGEFVEIVTDFEFGVELDSELFEMKVPEGYASEEKLIGEQHKLAKQLVVSHVNGLNQLGFNSSIEEAVDFLGEPAERLERKTPGPGGEVHFSTTLFYPNAGLNLFYNSDGLASITCEAHSFVIDFAGKTDSGIEFGDPIAKVIEIYGQPEVTTENTLIYLRKGITFSGYRGVVGGIRLKGVADPRIEFVVSEDGQSWSEQVRTPKKSD